MTTPPLDHRLGPEDYAFLLMDSESTPMNIGSLAIFDGDVPVRAFTENIESKLHLIPRYTQVIVPAPFDIGRPSWEDDPHFNIARHIHELWLDPPGSEDQLLDLTARLLEGRIDRSKPLWECYLVKGLADGNTALFTKMHHALVDGVGGVQLAMVMLDTTPDPPRVTYTHAPRGERLPTRGRLLTDALIDGFEETFQRWSAWRGRFRSLVFGGDRSWLRTLRRAVEVAVPYFALPVQRASFNGTLSPDREVAVTAFPLAEFREMRAATGSSINDIALAVLGRAVGAYMRDNDEPTEARNLRVLTPVNVRRQDEHGRMGNRISMLLVEVPLWDMAPLERLAGITDRTTWLKAERPADGMELVAEELFMAPPALLKAAALLGAPRNTLANMICTNVAGPTVPLYTVGHRLLSHYAFAPTSWEMGLGCALTSYDTELAFSLVADPNLVPSLTRFRQYLEAAYEEMRERVLGDRMLLVEAEIAAVIA